MTHTPSIFQPLHTDTVHMTLKSNGCKYIVHGRCTLSSWVEGKPLKNETARTVDLWLFEKVICRWGCLEVIITDDGSVFLAAVKWLKEKYGMKGIRISPYNSKQMADLKDHIGILYKCSPSAATPRTLLNGTGSSGKCFGLIGLQLERDLAVHCSLW